MQYDDIVIGSGISGLGYAYYQGKKHRVLVLDKEATIGGACDSRTSDKIEDFWVEMGAHTLYNSYHNIINLIEDLRISDQLIKREKLPFKVYDNGQVRSVFSYLSLFRFICGVFLLQIKRKHGLEVSEYYSDIFGKKNYQAILSDCFNAVLSQNAASFPAELLFNRKRKNKDYPRSFTLYGGISQLFNALIESQHFELMPYCEAQSVRKIGNCWQVNTSKGVFSAKRIVFATSPNQASILLREEAVELSQLLSTISSSKIYSIGLVFHHSDCMHIPKLAGLIGKGDAPFYSVVSRDVIAHPIYRGFTCHMKPNTSINQKQLIGQACQALGLSQEKAIEIFCKVNEVPQLSVKHLPLVRKISSLTKGLDIYLTGNYFKRLALEDCLGQSLSLLK
ncbi:FAD-dependent oxidoreductase [Thiotrichales bacterium 19S11-10]|nr:FAD-dependent oxidoreductase [Thiotrichales bacterium 19S11-10]